MGQIRDFFRSDSVHQKMKLNLIWKSPKFVPFGATWPSLGPNLSSLAPNIGQCWVDWLTLLTYIDPPSLDLDLTWPWPPSLSRRWRQLNFVVRVISRFTRRIPLPTLSSNPPQNAPILPCEAPQPRVRWVASWPHRPSGYKILDLLVYFSFTPTSFANSFFVSTTLRLDKTLISYFVSFNYSPLKPVTL